MRKETKDFLENCIKEGIISEEQRNKAFAIDKVQQEKKEEILKNFLNLLVGLMVVFLILSGIIVVFQRFNFINPIVKLIIAASFLAISHIGIVRSKINKNYFLLEIFVAMNACATLMFIMSSNMETVFRYRADANSFLTAVAMFPVFALTKSYISLVVYSFGFITSSIPELNFAILTYPNEVYALGITAIYLGLLIYKFMKLYNDDNKNYEVNKYFSKHVMLIVLEVLVLLFVFRLCFIGTGKLDVVFVYLIMLWILVRRTVLFKNLVPIPMIIDIIVFFGSIYLFIFSEPMKYNPSVVLLYHALYYLVVLLLNQAGYIEQVPAIYKVQQNFYINLFLFVFTLERVIVADNTAVIVTVILGLFNSYIGLRYKSGIQSVIGFGIIMATLVFTTLTTPTTIGGTLFASAGFIIAYINRDMLREVIKGNG